MDATSGCLTVSFQYFLKGHISGGCYYRLSYCHVSIFPERTYTWWMLLEAVLLSVFNISRKDVSLVDATSCCLIVIFLWLCYCQISIFLEGRMAR